MRYVVIFLILLFIFALGWLMGASSKLDFCAGTLHIDKDYDYMWQFEFDRESSLEECKKHHYICFRVDKDAKLSQ